MVDERFADWDVAIVEPRRLGGTCLNVGCIPTKMLVQTAEVATQARGADRFGIDVDGAVTARWPQVRDRIFDRIDARAENGYLARTTRHPNITMYTGHARFTGPKSVAVTGADGEVTEISGDQIVIAVGGRPRVPEPFVRGEVPYDTSDTVMRLDQLPRRLAIVGGGYIAAEFAHVFSGLGCEVTIIARGTALLTHHDREISELFTGIAREQWDVRLGRTVTAAAGVLGDITLTCDDGSTVDCDRVLLAVGRDPNTEALDLARAGVETWPDGRVRTDSFLRTTAPSVYAIGDVTSPHALKHVANREARTLAHNLTRPDQPIEIDRSAVPSAVFSRPQIASVGLTEEQVRADGRPYVAHSCEYSAVAYGWALEDTTGRCKVIADPATGLLLGAHLIGPQASTLIGQLVQAMVFETPVGELARRQFWIHPALSEVVENALLGADQKIRLSRVSNPSAPAGESPTRKVAVP